MPKKDQSTSYFSVVPALTALGLIAHPVDNKRPILRAWNRLKKTPDKLYIFENYNIGVLTGYNSGITVLDVDAKNRGRETWERLSSAYPEIKTPIVETANGGLHIYFRYNKRIRSFSGFTLRGQKIGWDLLNNDRQVVVPPSKNPISNKEYKWIISPWDIGFAPMPSWLEEYLALCKSFQ